MTMIHCLVGKAMLPEYGEKFLEIKDDFHN